MSVRLAYYSDLDAITEVFTQSFRNESMVSGFLHVRKDGYPEEKFIEDMRRYWRTRMRLALCDRASQVLVAVESKPVPSGEGETENVVGAAIWKKFGDDEKLELWDRWEAYIATYFAKSLNYLDESLFPNRSMVKSRANSFMEAFPLNAHHWKINGREVHWALLNLGVLPEKERKGYGTQLVNWGLEKAKTEGLAANVVSSAGSEPFYEKCGFNVNVGKFTEGEGNPLASVAGGAILFKERGSD